MLFVTAFVCARESCISFVCGAFPSFAMYICVRELHETFHPNVKLILQAKGKAIQWRLNVAFGCSGRVRRGHHQELLVRRAKGVCCALLPCLSRAESSASGRCGVEPIKSHCFCAFSNRAADREQGTGREVLLVCDCVSMLDAGMDTCWFCISKQFVWRFMQ